MNTRQIAIIGLSHIGLPLAYAFLQAGEHVIGFDRNEQFLAQLRNGVSRYGVPSLSTAIELDKITLTANPSSIASADCILICTPTTLDSYRLPDLAELIEACETVVLNVRRKSTVIVESTTYPGFTGTRLLSMFQNKHPDWRVGVDYFLAYSPERVDNSEDGIPLIDIPKVVGGVTQFCTDAAYACYARAGVRSIVRVSSTQIAELTTLLENAYRLVNISFINEFSAACRMIGVDPIEIIRAASTKPTGFVAFMPSLGAGGHHAPIDPAFLADFARTIPVGTRLLDAAISINANMPFYWTRVIEAMLDERDIAPSDASVLILGVTYKPDLPDTFGSMPIELGRRLHQMGITVRFHDPYVDSITLNGTTIQRVPYLDTAVADASLVVIGVPHRSYMSLQLWPAADVLDPSGAIKNRRA